MMIPSRRILDFPTMISIRSFRNFDPAAILDIWGRCKSVLGNQLRPLSEDLLEQWVLGQQLFVPEGLLLAWDESAIWDDKPYGHHCIGRPVGLIHATIIPNWRRVAEDPTFGIVCMLLAVPDRRDAEEIRQKLLKSAESYLHRSGIRTICGGSTLGGAPVFNGFVGAAGLVSIAETNPAFQTFSNAGYAIRNRTKRLEIDLAGYGPPFDLNVRRWQGKAELVFERDPKPKTWREALDKIHDRWIHVHIYVDPTERPVGFIVVRIPTLATVQKDGKPVSEEKIAELVGFELHRDYRSTGIFNFAFRETLRELVDQDGIRRLATIVSDEYAHLLPTFRVLGLEETGEGAVFIKSTATL